MTLSLEHLSSKNFVESKLIINAVGSEAGPLISKLNLSGFKVHCSKDSVLKLSVSEPKEGDKSKPVGTGTFSAPIFIQLNQSDYDPNRQLSYEVPVFDDSGKEVGILVFGVYYDKTKYYQGEYTESSLVHMPKQVESHPEPVMVAPSKPNPNKEPVRFYKGACESRNLFSIFDEGSTNQPFRVYERYYRDHLEQQQ